jgi:hypothetical protein
MIYTTVEAIMLSIFLYNLGYFLLNMLLQDCLDGVMVCVFASTVVDRECDPR